MSAISLKSITGITSITTPAGVDNQLTLHTNNTTERLKIDEAGNVRVANTFDCVGVSTFRNNLFAQADLRIAGEIVHLSDDDTRMQFPSNDTIAFKTAGSERLRITSAGLVGIGVENPSEILHIRKNDTQGPTITLQNNANKAYINNWGSVGGGSGRTNRFEINAVLQAQASICAQYITFMTGGNGDSNEKIRITSTGQFHMGGGSGWTYASQKFVVVEPNNNLGMLLQGNNANEGVNLTLQNIVNANNAYSSLSFADDGGQIFGVVRGKVIDKNANTGELQFWTSGSERLRISSDGRVQIMGQNAIAATSLTHRLLVRSQNDSHAIAIAGRNGDHIGELTFYQSDASTRMGEIQAHTTHLEVTSRLGYLSFQAGGPTERVRITSGGQVNIGGDYTQTAYNLSVTNTGGNLFRIKTADQGDYDLRFMVQNSESNMWHYGTDDFVFGNRYDRKLHFITNGSKRLTIHGSYVGINQTAPQTGLHINQDWVNSYGSISAEGSANALVGLGLRSNGNYRGALIFRDGSTGNYLDLATFGGAYPILFRINGDERLRITSTGSLQHTAASGVSYFTGSSEYCFNSTTSCPTQGGNEARVQINENKTRATLSINAFMNNAGGPNLTFISSRSGTIGVLGTKCINGDVLGQIRFRGDNATTAGDLASGADIMAYARSTPADGDTVCEGELSFRTGNANGGAVQSKLQITGSGKIKYGLHDSSMPHAVQARGFVLYPNNGSNNKTTIRVSGLVSGCFIFQMGYYNSSGQGEGGFACAVSGYMTSTNQYTIDNIKAPYAHANSSISGINKQNSYFEFTITNNHGSYTGGGTIGIIGDQEMAITVTYHS